jgi:flagellar P-ring protein precursor FlgI
VLVFFLLALCQKALPAPDAQHTTDVRLHAGAVEAPRQPEGASQSLVVRGPRADITPGMGAPGGITVRIGDMAAVRGQEENQVQGIGLVMGLAGTGDSTIAARQAVINLLKTQNIVLDLQSVSSANVAVVLVQATLEPGIKPGRQIDVRVASLYDCESLVGGTLLATELADMTGSAVYATAAGPITTGAFAAEGQGASATRNHLTVGTIPMGGKVERDVPTQIVSDHGFVYLDLRALKGSFANATRIAQSINALYPNAAVPEDAMTVAVSVPGDLPQEATVSFLNSVLEREIEPAPFARVVVNERTGVIVMGEGVRISRGAITKGNLTVTIAETPEASQPGPLSQGKTEVLPRTSVLVEEEDRPLTIVNGAVTLAQVVEVLNVLGVTPRDMIQILQLMAQSGMLHAEVLVM